MLWRRLAAAKSDHPSPDPARGVRLRRIPIIAEQPRGTPRLQDANYYCGTSNGGNHHGSGRQPWRCVTGVIPGHYGSLRQVHRTLEAVAERTSLPEFKGEASFRHRIRVEPAVMTRQVHLIFA